MATKKKKRIKVAHLDEGSFTTKAKKAGKTVGEYAEEKAEVLAEIFRKMAKKK